MDAGTNIFVVVTHIQEEMRERKEFFIQTTLLLIVGPQLGGIEDRPWYCTVVQCGGVPLLSIPLPFRRAA